MEQLTILSDDLAAPTTAVLEQPRSTPNAPDWRQRLRQSRAGAALSSFPSRVFLLALAFYLTLTCLHLWLTGSPAAQQTAPGGVSLADWGTAFTATWRRFDSYFFLHIARLGYTNQGLGAFFPLYPLLIRLFAWPLAGHFTLAALLVSWLCAWGSYLWFYRLAAREFGARVARLALLFLALSPVSFFSFAPYSESLFLLVSIGAVERARAGRLWQASLLAALGMLTRPTGLLLLLPLAWEWGRRSPTITRWLKGRRGWRLKIAPEGLRPPSPSSGTPIPHLAAALATGAAVGDAGGWGTRAGGFGGPGHLGAAFNRLRGWAGRSWLALGLVPLALLGYMLFLKLHNHNALAFLAGESAWHRHFTLPWQTVGLFATAFQQTWQAGAYTALLGNVVDLLLVVPLPALVLYCAICRKRLWPGAALYQLALTLMLIAVPNVPALATGEEVLLSTQRFML
ncbi:MAG TPA: mannosyltransferase family protein, partial [Ktedonobacterales bacterium]